MKKTLLTIATMAIIATGCQHAPEKQLTSGVNMEKNKLSQGKSTPFQ